MPTSRSASVLFVVVFFSLFFSKKIIASDFIVSFEYKESAPLDSNVAAFQYWWNNLEDEENFEKANELLNPYDVNPAVLLNVMGFDKNDKDWKELNHRLDFASELTTKEKEQLLRFINDFNSKIENKKENLRKNNKSYLLLEFAASSGRVKISWINYSLRKEKSPKIVANQKLIPVLGNSWLNKNGRFRKPSVRSGENIEQYFAWDMNQDLTISFVDKGNVNKIKLTAFEKNPPYIVDFFASDFTPVENQRVFLTWNVIGTKEVMIDMGVGAQPSKWQVTIAPEDTASYTLMASNFHGSVTRSVVLEVERVVLTSAIITVFTPEKGDSKAVGSKIVATLEGFDKGELARFEGATDLECEGAKTPYVGPFKFSYNTPVFKRDFIRGQFTVMLEGDKPDEWLFSPIVILQFSDGSKRELLGFGNRLLRTGGAPEIFKF
jgi:hypothetical protein